MPMNSNESIIFFDGVCTLCNGVIDFIIKRDHSRRFKYASLQGNTAKKMIKSYLEQGNLDSLIFYKGGEIYVESSAALHIARNMNGLWPLLFGFMIVPKFIRDAVYRWVARNRYRWFGKRNTCRIATPEERAYLLD